MIWIQCDRCNRMLVKDGRYVTYELRNFGVKGYVPTTVHLCESCLEAVRKSWEVVKHDV